MRVWVRPRLFVFSTEYCITPGCIWICTFILNFPIHVWFFYFHLSLIKIICVRDARMAAVTSLCSCNIMRNVWQMKHRPTFTSVNKLHLHLPIFTLEMKSWKNCRQHVKHFQACHSGNKYQTFCWPFIKSLCFFSCIYVGWIIHARILPHVQYCFAYNAIH